MSNLSAPIGAILRARFPQAEAILRPGPKVRPVLVLDTATRSDGRMEVLVAYGTSQHPERIGYGNFTVQAHQTVSLRYDTRFDLNKVFWLPLSSEIFVRGPQQVPELIPAQLIPAFRKAAVEAKLI